MQVNVQPLDVNEPRVVPGEIELARSLEVNAGGGGSGQRAVPALHKFRAALVACLGFGEHLVGLHVEEPAAHAGVAHDAFQVAHAATTAVPFLGVERHHHMAAFPHAFRMGITAVADAVGRVDDHDHVLAALDCSLRALHCQLGHLGLVVERAVVAPARHLDPGVGPVADLFGASAGQDHDHLELGMPIAQHLYRLAQQVAGTGAGRAADSDA